MDASWLAKVAASALVRRLVYVTLAAVLAWLGMGQARADTQSNTAGEAYALCQASGENYVGGSGSRAYNCEYRSAAQVGGTITVNGQSYPRANYRCFGTSNNWTNSSFCSVASGSHYNHYFPEGICSEGSTWDAGTGQCVEDGPTPEECAARGALSNVYGSDSTVCDGGCAFSGGGAAMIGLVLPDGTEVWPNVSWYPTGETCTAGDNAQPIADEGVCAPVSNLTMCAKPNGQHCATASTGRRICWNPGETGTKTDGPVAQVRHPGATEGPAPAAPPGETMTRTGGPATTTTLRNTGGTVTTSTTTITNYTTFNGTNAGPTDGGEGDDGSGDGSITGGADCSSPPVASGGDPVLAAMVDQQWRARCSDGGQGDAIGAAVGEADGLLNAEDMDPATHEALQGQASEVIFEEEILPSEIFGDVTGFLPNASCPLQPDVAVGDAVASFDLTPLCDIFINLGNLLLVLAYLKGARLYVGGP